MTIGAKAIAKVLQGDRILFKPDGQSERSQSYFINYGHTWDFKKRA